MADKVALDAIYKDVAVGEVINGVREANPFKDLFKFETDPFGGRELIRAAKVGRNVSPFFSGEDGAFADAGNQQHTNLRIDQRKLTARVELTREAMNDSMKSEYAFVQARKDEMKGIIEDIARREEHALVLDGRGVLARVDESDPDGDTTLELDAPGGITHDSFGNRYIQKGMYIGFVNPATGQLRASTTKAKVTAVNSDGTDVTVDAAANIGTAVANSDYVVQLANSSVTTIQDSAYEKAFWGILALVDDGTYRSSFFGANRTSFPNFASYVKASTGAFSVDVLQQSADVVSQKLGGRIDKLYMHHSTRRLYINTLEADRRYAGSDLKRPDAGTVAFKQGDLTMGEVPIKAIDDFALDIIVGVDSSAGWICYQAEPGKWVDEDGSVFVRVGSGSSARDKFEAWWVQRKQYFVEQPGKSFRNDGVTGQSLVVVRGE